MTEAKLSEQIHNQKPSGDTANTHLLSASELFSNSFTLFKRKFWDLVAISVIPTILLIFAGFISGIVVGIFSAYTKGGPLLPIIFIFVFLILFVLVGIWSSISLVTSLVAENKLSFASSFKKSAKFIFPYIRINILITFIFIGGALLFIFPGIIFAVWFSFAVFTLVVDNQRGIKSLLLSKEYIKGHWWSVLGRLLLIGLLPPIVFIFLSLIGVDGETFFGSIFFSVLSLVFSVFSLCYTYTLFKNLKTIRGSSELHPSKKSTLFFYISAVLGFAALVFIPILTITAINPEGQLNNAREVMLKNQKASLTSAVIKYVDDNNVFPESFDDLYLSGYLNKEALNTAEGYCFSVSVNKSNYDVLVNYGRDTEIECNQIEVQ